MGLYFWRFLHSTEIMTARQYSDFNTVSGSVGGGGIERMSSGREQNSPRSKKTNVHEQMGALVFSLNFVGINLIRKFKRCSNLSRCSDICHGVYSTVILLFLGVNVSRWMGWLGDTKTSLAELMLDIHTIVWGLHNLCHYVAFYIEPYIYANFQSFILVYQAYNNSYSNGAVTIRRIVVKYVIIYWLTVLMSVSVTTYYDFCSDNAQTKLLYPLHTDSNYVWLIKLLNAVVIFYLTAVWQGVTLLIVVISKCLAREFCIINQEIIRSSQEDLNCLLKELEQFRRRHHAVCKLTASINKLLSLHFALDVTATMVMLCMMLYVIIWDDAFHKDPGAAISLCFWITVAMGKVLVECYFASILNEAVSKKWLFLQFFISSKDIRQMGPLSDFWSGLLSVCHGVLGVFFSWTICPFGIAELIKIVEALLQYWYKHCIIMIYCTLKVNIIHHKPLTLSRLNFSSYLISTPKWYSLWNERVRLSCVVNDTKSVVNSGHRVDLDIPEYSGFNTRGPFY